MDNIWRCRNQLVFQKKQINTAEIAIQIKKAYVLYKETFSPDITPSNLGQGRYIPPLGWHHVNFDAAVRHNRSIQAAIIRDCKGTIIVAQTRLEIQLEPTVAEATAALLAIDSAIQSKCTNVIFEGDAALIVKWLNDHEECPEWRCLTIIHEAREKLKLFSCWDFVKVHRSVNSHAHELAKWADVNNYFGLVPPSSLSSFLPLDEVGNQRFP